MLGNGEPSQINIYSPITKYDSISLHDFHFPYWPIHPLDAVIDTNWGTGVATGHSMDALATSY